MGRKLRVGLAALVTILTATTASAGCNDAAPVGLRLVQTPAGGESEAEIGQAMLTSGRVAELPAIEVLEPVAKRDGIGNKVHIEAGLYLAAGTNSLGQCYRAPKPLKITALGITDRVEGGVVVPTSAGATTELYYYSAAGIYFRTPQPVVFRRTVYQDPSLESFRRELVYTGVSKGVVTLQYREYRKEMARPAFTQSLTYDLADGDEIGYGGARIRILRATNTAIVFQVLRPLSPDIS